MTYTKKPADLPSDGEAIEAACKGYWPTHWPHQFAEADRISIRRHMSNALTAVAALYRTSDGASNGEVEAVAWRMRYLEHKTWVVCQDKPAMANIDQFEIEPLYAAPPAPTAPDETNERLRKALEFYADENNWIDTPPWDGDPDCITPKAIPVRHGGEDGSPCDCGDTARQALSASSSKEGGL